MDETGQRVDDALVFLTGPRHTSQVQRSLRYFASLRLVVLMFEFIYTLQRAACLTDTTRRVTGLGNSRRPTGPSFL